MILRGPSCLLVIGLAGCPRSASTPASPPRANDDEGAGEHGQLVGLTAAHNAERTKVGVAPLVWSRALARHAQAWADRLASKGCALEHHTSDEYGENLYWSSGSASAEAVVAKWAAEAASYNHRRNSCNGVCGHYTQVVWSDSRSLGCGMASCGDAEIWVCNYDPPGNVGTQAPY